jgi:predicted RNase H-like HicB family nuclease
LSPAQGDSNHKRDFKRDAPLRLRRHAQAARSGLEALMKHYIAIFVENQVGEWRALFPDAPGCEAKGFSLDDAKYAAASALIGYLRESNAQTPLPMDMAAVHKSEEWLKQNQVDLSRAVVSMIPLAA